jgi:hypothetical protein
MDDTRSVCSTHSDGSHHSVLTTQTNVSTTRIPVRLTRAQRLANEKRRQQREKRENEERIAKLRQISNSRKHTSQRSMASRPSMSRPSTRNIHYNTQKSISNIKTKIPQVSPESNEVDISLSHQVASLDKQETHTIEQTRKRLVKLPAVKDLIHSMIYDLISICSTTHYSKVGGLFVKQDIKKSKSETDISGSAKERDDWIKTKQKDYPLVLTDLIARGCFQADLPSSYPSVEVFRNSYINPNTAKCSLLEGYTLWELFGTFAFTFSVIKNLYWNKIHIQYDDDNAKCALNQCLDCNLDWGFFLWKAGKDGLHYTRKTS